MRYIFTGTGPDAKDFWVEADDAGKITEAEGIGPATLRFYKNGSGITGLIRNKMHSHTVAKAAPGGKTLADSLNQKGDEESEEDGDDDSGDDEVAKMGDIVKTLPSKQIVFGWAYTTHDKSGKLVVDKSGEFIDDMEELESAAYKYVVKSRMGGADHARDVNNGVVQVGELVESMVFTPEKAALMGIAKGSIPECAWWVGIKINDPEVWSRVMKGELTSFSIAGKALKKDVTQ